ncbi:hypothetical protein GQ607_012233 [Colletotrichum asianum]|uniref:Uncharacterized protein n=1 Tax=Colletotrichum asianum TaxID=702518 RepID=A0A8H3W961_9PEZI|nr:hypothetical protein GQ607_012233 [Colletotrichum asianum]
MVNSAPSSLKLIPDSVVVVALDGAPFPEVSCNVVDRCLSGLGLSLFQFAVLLMLPLKSRSGNRSLSIDKGVKLVSASDKKLRGLGVAVTGDILGRDDDDADTDMAAANEDAPVVSFVFVSSLLAAATPDPAAAVSDPAEEVEDLRTDV